MWLAVRWPSNPQVRLGTQDWHQWQIDAKSSDIFPHLVKFLLQPRKGTDFDACSCFPVPGSLLLLPLVSRHYRCCGCDCCRSLVIELEQRHGDTLCSLVLLLLFSCLYTYVCLHKILNDIGYWTEESHMMSVLVDIRQYLDCMHLYAMQCTFDAGSSFVFFRRSHAGW